MNIDLRMLRYVVTVARLLSFSRAAEALGISQPALTRAVQGVERDFGVRLFDRDRSGVAVTPDGARLIERAQTLLGEASDFGHFVTATAKGDKGHVTFGMAPFPASALLSASLAMRIAEAPGLANHAVVRDVHALSRILLAGEIEFFLAAEQQVEDVPRIRRERIGIFRNALIVRAGHPLNGREDVGRRYPLLQAGAAGARRLITAGDADFLLPNPHVIEDFGAIRTIVAQTDAVMLASIYSVLDDVRAGRLVLLDRGGPSFTSEVGIELYWLQRRTRSHGALALRDSFRRIMKNLEADSAKLFAASPPHPGSG